MHIPEQVRDQVERIRADGEQQAEKLFADITAEGLELLQRLRGNDADLIPLRLVCKALAFEAMAAEPLPRQKGIAYYETACVSVRNAKAAIRAGIMTPRLQGSGLPVDLSRWCAEDDIPCTIEEFMENSRIMVRRRDARSWLESLDAEAPGILHCKQTQAAPAEEVPADLEEPKQTRRMTEAKKAIRAILRTADRRSLSRSAAYDFVVVAIRDGNVPSPYQMEEEKDESGGRVFVWTDTKGEKQRLRPDTLRRYVREAWDEL